MSIIPAFKTPNDLFLKLCRESLKVHGSKTNEDLQDNFFNFCITAQSLRDWIKKSKKIGHNEIHDYCNQFPELEICRDIANCSKHFTFDNKKSGAVLEVKENENVYKAISIEKTEEGLKIIKPNLTIIVNDNEKTEIRVLDFMNIVIEKWENIFDHFEENRKNKPTDTRSLTLKIGNYKLEYI